MSVTDVVASLKVSVQAAFEEFDQAVAFREVWRYAAYDHDLHQRMGKSYATNTFRIIRVALWRETLLALARLWDTRPRTVRMDVDIGEKIRKAAVIEALATERAKRRGSWPGDREQIKKELSAVAAEAIGLIDKYHRGGTGYKALQRLLRLRHEHLGHRSLGPASAHGPGPTDAEIELIFHDHRRLIAQLLHLVLATDYSAEEAAKVHQYCAKFFWAAVRGERTEGHPNFRPAPNSA